ncbi:MAG: hypothetical protein GF331_07795 [Chitinivibrionales bacterium]|nr:hypothetical protein [Chitinivibrionales bacterium]
MQLVNRGTIAALVLVGLVSGAVAGDSSVAAKSSVRTRTVGGYISVGGVLSDLDAFNTRVRDYGFAELKDYGYHLGIGTFTVRKRLITGLELKGVAWRPTETANRVTELYGLSGIVNVGFSVLPEGRFRLYPYIGAGFGQLFLRLRQESATFGEALSEPLDDVVLNQRVGALQAGIGADFSIPRRHRPHRSRVIGLRAGYVFDPSPARDWRSADIRIGGGPSVAANGVYAQLVFGKSAERSGWFHGKRKAACGRGRGCPKHDGKGAHCGKHKAEKQ